MRTERHVPLSRCFGFATVIAIAACSPGADRGGQTGDSAAGTTAAANDTGMAGMAHDSGMAGMAHDSGMGGMAGMAGMTGDADRDFLRMMSDHHKGLIAMAHETLEKQGQVGVKEEARALDRKQDEELDRMSTMLRQYYQDSYEPKVMPDNQAMVEQLERQSGAAYDRTFRENVIKHHEQAIQMIDQYLSKAKRAEVRAMAEKMKADQTREIAQLRRELGQG